MNNLKNNDGIFLERLRYWNNKERYLNLLEKFLDGKIDGNQFTTDFVQIWEEDRDRTDNFQELFQKLKHVDVTKLKSFSNLILELFNDCEVFEPDPALRADYEISEKELKDLVRTAVLKIKTDYP